MAERLMIDLRDVRDAVIVPVPLHRTRLRERGFNQAERLARVAAREARCHFRADILVRTRSSVSQTTLDLEERRASVAGAFQVRGRTSDLPIILVDDVWTTGATAEACRGVLREAGSQGPIRVLVAARTLSRSRARALHPPVSDPRLEMREPDSID
jgi:ComF family protein